MSTINEFLNRQKQIQAQIDAVDPDAIKKSQREKDKESMQADIDVSIAGYDSQINNTQAYYDKQIGDTKIAYEDAYQKNAVQKLINEKQIAERNANLGLTDSGLNRTQQTAAQLSYANQKGKIDLSRQSALDELNLKLTDAITTLENDKATAVRNIANNWNAYSDEQAQNTYNTKITGLVNQYNSLGEQITDMYKANTDAAAEVEKERIKAVAESQKNKSSSLLKKNIISRNYTGTLESNGIRWARFTDDNGDDKVKYVDSSTGDMVIMDWGQNPYTLDQNLSKFNSNPTALAAQKFGVYSHGYQPKGLCVIKNGKPVYYDFESSESYYVPALERNQNVFKIEDGTEWIWNDAGNKYVKWNYDRKTGEVNLPDWVY